jgi:hypothetical protein
MTERKDSKTPFQYGIGEAQEAERAARKPRSWRWLIGLLLVALGAGAGYLYYFKRDLLQGWVNKTPLDLQIVPTVTRVYKWRDAQGNWQMTDRPPAGRDYEVKEFRSDKNLVPALEAE